MSIIKKCWNMLASEQQMPRGEEQFMAMDSRGGAVSVMSKTQLKKYLHGYAAACQHAVGNGIAGLEIVARDPRTKKVRTDSQSVVDEAFSCRKTQLTRQDLLYKLGSDLIMTGNAYLANIDNSLEYISGDVSVKEWQTYAGIIVVPSKYTVTTDLTAPTEVLADKLIHFKYRLLDGACAGRGALEDCNLEADTNIELSRFIRAYFKNFAMPGLHISVKKGGIAEVAFKKLADKIQASFGAGGRGGTFVTSDGVSVTPLGNNLVDSKSVDVMNTLKVIVCGAYGVPVDVIDATNTNRATASASIRLFYQNTVMPIAWAICARMNMAYTSVIFEPMPYDSVDPLEGDRVVGMLQKQGILTVEEARSQLRSVRLTK